MSQTSYSQDYTPGRAGMIADDRLLKHIASRVAEGPLVAGRGAFRVPGYGSPGTTPDQPGLVYQAPTPAIAADPDAIIATIASAATEQTLTTADADGVHGAAALVPARTPTLTLSNHADWDATTAVLTYLDEAGVQQTANLAIPNDGNATVTATGVYMSQFVSLYIPAQSGTGGTADLGVTVLDSGITLADFEGVVMYDAAHEPGVADSAEFADAETVPMIFKGSVWVTTEDACSAGGTPYVRIGSGAGGSDLGAFRSDDDTSTAVAVTGARYKYDSAIGGLNVVELY